MVDGLCDDGLVRLMNIIKRDLSLVRKGFPDLTVIYARGNFEFVEVKGPNDRVQPAQRIWLRHLTEANLACRVLDWKYKT